MGAFSLLFPQLSRCETWIVSKGSSPNQKHLRPAFGVTGGHSTHFPEYVNSIHHSIHISIYCRGFIFPEMVELFLVGDEE